MYSTCTTIEEIRGIRHPSETDMRGGQSYRGTKKSGERDRTKLFGSRTEKREPTPHLPTVTHPPSHIIAPKKEKRRGDEREEYSRTVYNIVHVNALVHYHGDMKSPKYIYIMLRVANECLDPCLIGSNAQSIE